MKVTMLLADSAQAVNGKLYILGGGWSVIGPEPSPMALALKVDLPWDRANMRHKWTLSLVDSDGRPVRVEPAEGGNPEPLAVRGEFEAGRPPGLKAGTDLDLTMAINFGPIPLEPDRRYEWRFKVDKIDDEWRVPFSTRPARV